MDLLLPNSRQFRPAGALRVALVIAAELAVIHFLRHRFGFECQLDQTPLCGAARNALLASYGVAAALVLLGLFDGRAIRHLLRYSDTRAVPLIANMLGLSLLIASLPLLRADLGPAGVAALWALWAAAAAAVIAGATLMLAPLRIWRSVLRRLGWVAPLAVIAGATAPFAARMLYPLWQVETLAALTFDMVTRLLTLAGTPVQSFPDTRVIGAESFFVNVANSCSGVEGLVLTTIFAAIYMALFRRTLRFPHALLILPLALLASWALNAVRIAVLVQIGISGYPGLAIGGFHSHAGWLMFTILSLLIVLTAQAVPLFHARVQVAGGEQEASDAPPAPPPFLSDPVVAQILPFAVFMASALLASTFAQEPALAYPMRAAAMGVVLALFWPYLEALPWRVDPASVLAGIAVAGLWIIAAPAPGSPPPVAALSGFAALVWVVARCVGTAVFVPVIEEIFFRGYLLNRIAPPGAPALRVAGAVVVTTALFAVLHDRWLEAALAGLVFAALALRARNVTNAIVAHAVANALIAGWALATGNWAMI